MEFIEIKNKIEQLKVELAQIENERDKFNKEYMNIGKKVRLCKNKQDDLLKSIKELEKIVESENIFESVNGLEGLETLTQDEKVVISNGMDRTDYRKNDNFPRWLDLEKLVNQVIKFKIHYPEWILERIVKSGQYDTLPPKNFYKFTYRTQQGYIFSHGGFEISD